MPITTGIPGIEAVHHWNGFTINDLTATDAQIKLNDITNWYGRPEFDDPRAPSTARRGEHVLPGALTGKTVVFEGTIRATSLAAWRTACRGLQAATLSVDTMLATVDGDPDWTYLARCIDRSIDENPDLSLNRVWPFQGSFAFSLRMEDGRFLALPKNASGPHTSGTSYSVTNAGMSDAEPDFAITGTTGSVMLYNSTINKHLYFAGMPSGTLTINFHNRTALIGTADAMTYLTKDTSDWWDAYVPGLVPGANYLQVTGGSWTVGWYDTDS